MAVGDEAQAQVESYVAVAKETALGTKVSATTAIEALTCSFRTDIESRKVDALHRSRGFARRVQLNKTVGGTLEQYLHPEESTLMLINAMGGTVTSASTSGGFIHSITVGNFEGTHQGLSFNVRKGPSLVWNYLGGRVNTLTLTGEIGEPIKCSYEMIFRDSTQLSDDIGASLSISSVLPFTFAQGVFQYGDSEGALATEQIQGFELTINNNIVSDSAARALGTNTASVLPMTRREVNLKVTQRFDTTTAYARFLQATTGSIDLTFTGVTISSDAIFTVQIRMPTVFLNSPDPELNSSGEILTSEIDYDVMVDNPSTTTGRELAITVTNNTQSY